MSLSIEDVSVRFGDRVILDRCSIEVAEHQIVAVLGPSGVGKSTLLRVVAGLQVPDAGRVSWRGRDLAQVPVHRRRIGMVFQDEQLFPHLDVAANIGFGLRMAGARRGEISARVDKLLELVGLPGFQPRDVAALSGGEAKRVALARSLAPRPEVLLLDEPLTGLDRELHDRLTGEIRRILTATGTTALLVTHDHEEAGTIADRTVTLGRATDPDDLGAGHP
ncbi:MAG: ABC transporter ATP-binding protein [Ilumatobacteraceae bacterium]